MTTLGLMVPNCPNLTALPRQYNALHVPITKQMIAVGVKPSPHYDMQTAGLPASDNDTR